MSAMTMLAIDAIAPDPNQPRSSLRDKALTDESKLQELALSISAHGVIEPIVVREGEDAGTFILIAGERRWRASRMAGLLEVPAIVREALTPEQVEEMAIAENTARLDLNPMEEARAFLRLMQRGLDEKAVSKTVGRSVSVIQRRLTLLSLDDDIQRMVELGQVWPTKAEILARVPRNHQYRLLRAVLDGTTDEALIVMAEQILYREQQSELFTEDEAPERSAKAARARRTIDETIERAGAALSALLDPATQQLLPEALGGDRALIENRLLQLEADSKRLRGAIRAAYDAERSEVYAN